MATRTRVRPTRGRPALTARNEDWTDREVLLLVQECCQRSSDNLATTHEVGVAMGFSTNGSTNRTPATAVGSRLAYMRDAGLLESHKPDPEHRRSYDEPGSHNISWELSPAGTSIVTGKLTNVVNNAIDKMKPGDKVLLGAALMKSTWIDGDHSTAIALDRQLKHDRSKAVHRVR